MILIVKIDNDFVNAGFLARCMVIGNVGAMIASYGVRGYQISDIKDKFSQSDYFTHRIINIIATVVIISLFCVFAGYGLAAITVVAYLFFKLTEVLTDLYHGIDQKNDRMDIIGKSGIIKGVAGLAAFLALYYLSRNLLAAVMAMFAVTMIATVIFDYKQAKQFGKIKFALNKNAYISLQKECFSPFVYSVCMSLIAALPRLYFENSHGVEMLGIYSSIATPAVIVQLAVSYLFMPLITLFTRYYNDKDRRFIRLFLAVSAIIAALCSVAVILSGFIGKPMLVFLFNPDVAEYSRIFITTVISSFLVGMIFFLFALLIVMRKMKTVFVCSITGVAAIIAASVAAINAYGIDGINYALIGAYLLMCIMGFISVFVSAGKQL